MVRSLTIGSKLDSQLGKPEVVKRLSNLLLLPLLMITAEMALFPRFGFGDVKKDRKNVSSRIAGEIARLPLHKIYVSDFLDVSDTRTDKGCYFSSGFSTLLKDQAKNSENLSRVDTQKFLVTAGLSATNLHNPESLAKLSAATGADAVLFGTLVLEKNIPLLLFSYAKRPVERRSTKRNIGRIWIPLLKLYSPPSLARTASFSTFPVWTASPYPSASTVPCPNTLMLLERPGSTEPFLCGFYRTG